MANKAMRKKDPVHDLGAEVPPANLARYFSRWVWGLPGRIWMRYGFLQHPRIPSANEENVDITSRGHAAVAVGA